MILSVHVLNDYRGIYMYRVPVRRFIMWEDYTDWEPNAFLFDECWFSSLPSLFADLNFENIPPLLAFFLLRVPSLDNIMDTTCRATAPVGTCYCSASGNRYIRGPLSSFDPGEPLHEGAAVQF